MNKDRRSILKQLAAVTGGLAVPTTTVSAEAKNDRQVVRELSPDSSAFPHLSRALVKIYDDESVEVVGEGRVVQGIDLPTYTLTVRDLYKNGTFTPQDTVTTLSGDIDKTKSGTHNTQDYEGGMKTRLTRLKNGDHSQHGQTARWYNYSGDAYVDEDWWCASWYSSVGNYSSWDGGYKYRDSGSYDAEYKSWAEFVYDPWDSSQATESHTITLTMYPDGHMDWKGRIWTSGSNGADFSTNFDPRNDYYQACEDRAKS